MKNTALANKDADFITTMKNNVAIDDLVKTIDENPKAIKYPPFEHFFGDNVVVRKTIIKKGMLMVGAIHKYQHITIMVHGNIAIWKSDEGLRIAKGDEIMVTEPGCRRALYAYEDTTFYTAHYIPTDRNNRPSDDDTWDYLVVETSKEFMEHIKDKDIYYKLFNIAQSEQPKQLDLWFAEDDESCKTETAPLTLRHAS